jgi:hypothetical protein
MGLSGSQEKQQNITKTGKQKKGDRKLYITRRDANKE